MTAVLERPDSPSHWGSMPGWNIVADMTPPELINLRWLGVLRRRILAALVLVVLLCAAGYFYVWSQNNAAASDATTASYQTVGLTQAAVKYSGITRIETTVAGIQTQISGVMATDVDLPHVLALVRQALPSSMAIQSLSVTIASAASTGAAGLDASGRPQIGTISIGGSGHTLDDLPMFVERLAAIPGVVNVVPQSNEVTDRIASFNLTAALTDQFYSHRFDASKSGH